MAKHEIPDDRVAVIVKECRIGVNNWLRKNPGLKHHRDDMHSNAILAVVEHWDKQFEHQIAFSTFIRHQITWACQDYRRNIEDHLSRAHRRAVSRGDATNVYVIGLDDVPYIDPHIALVDEHFDAVADKDIVQAVIAQLNDRQRFILGKYLSGIPLRQIGTMLGITESRASQIKTGVYAQLFAALEATG